MTLTVSSEAVAAYRPLVESLANRFKGHDFADYDDLYQVGLIRVWKVLAQGRKPSRIVVEHAMRDELRRARRQGEAGFTPIPTDLEDDFMSWDGSAL